MKKRFLWIGLIFFLAGGILFTGINILVGITFRHHIDFTEKIILGFGYAAMFVLIQIPIAYYTFFPRIKYLENNNNEKPPFKIVCSSVIDVPKGIDFTRLKNEIAGKWLITFSDESNYVLKFRENLSFWKNTRAAWLKYDSDAGKLHVDCFPMTAPQDNAIARKMLKEIEDSLKSIFG